jgi:hypothetical protein
MQLEIQAAVVAVVDTPAAAVTKKVGVLEALAL